jgi:predicted transcriptional regulator
MPPLPTGAALEILAALWQRGPTTVRQVHEALGKESVYTTTLKQMQVITEKGLLVRNERFCSHVYETGARREDTQQQTAGDLLRRAFGGSAANLAPGALKAQPASEEDLAEIRRLLREFGKRERSR